MSSLLHVLMLVNTVAESDMLARELRRAGFELELRCASTEATYLAELKLPLDLILADNALLEFDAMRALQILRASELDIPLIVVTESAGEESAIECVSLGAADFVFKDRPARLGSAVVRALDQRELRAHTRAADAALRASEEYFRAIFEGAALGIVLADREGCVLVSNAAFQSQIGYTEAELRAAPLIEFIFPEDRARASEKFDELLAGQRTDYRDELRYIHTSGRTVWARPTVSLVRNDDGDAQFAVITIEDIDARKQADQALRQKTAFIQLFQEVAVAANQATSFDQALQTAVDTICTHIGWPVGHVYLPDPEMPEALLSTGIWHLEDAQRFATFRKITEAVRLAPGIGLPGQALASRKPTWIADMLLDISTPRTRLIQDIGVRAGFALPVLLGDQVAAVLEFFATEAITPDEALLDVLHHVGTQLGRVVERARAEAALRESEARFRVLFEYSPDAIVLIDPHESGVLWPIVECNDVACRMNGYTRGELIGQSIDLLNLEAGIPAEQAAYVERLRSEGTIRFENYHRRKDGGLFPIEVVSSLISVAGRELVLGIDRDISERKRVEDALRAAEAQYRTLVEQIPAIIYTAAIDERSSTLYVSPQIESILGFSPEEWIANPDLWFERVHPDDRAPVLDAVDRAQTSDAPVPLEYRALTRDGGVVWLRDAARVVRDEAGRPLFMQGITLDITDRKRAENALRESERLYRTLASNFPNGAVVLFDHDLRFTIADGAGLADLGLTRERAEGHTIWDVFPPEECAAIEPIYRAALAGTPHVREIALGAHIYVIHTLPVRDEHGEIIAGMNMSQDITEHKRIEEALIEERALLARRVDERTADLSAANAELARTAMLKDEFLASMSHELRTPLNAVLGLSEALQEEVYGPLNDRQRRSLHSIEESGRHLLDLINDILDLAKIGAGKLELDLEPSSIETICQASLRLIKQIAHKKRLSIDMTIDPAVTMLNVDARRLKQILVNLLSNAVKFTPEGGSIGLEVVGDVMRQAVDLTVWDTGIGIAQEQMPRLFQPFVQLDSRLARQYEGTGLGLALVYRMSEMHGGSIAVTSEVGRGSRFTVALPWHIANAAAQASAPAAPEVVALGRTTIRRALVVEDSPTTADQITRYLHELAIESETVRNGAEVVALTIAEQPDLIFLDLLLPDISGWDVLALLKAEPRTRAIPVLITSVVDDRPRGLALGAAEYLVKPVARADLQRVLPTLTPTSIELIMSAQAPRAGAPSARAIAPPMVLLAEDNEANITMISDYLGTRSYQVVVARNGAEAIARAREARPAIVLMDIQMPGMDGLEATRRIRAIDDLVDLPIIALTALAMPGDRERCLAAGANDYLSKPVSLRGLANLIEHNLRQHSSQ